MKKVDRSAFKAHVVEMLKEAQSLAQLSREHGVHANVVRDRKAVALKNLASVFERRDDAALTAIHHQHQRDALYATSGKLTTQVNWLKKSFQFRTFACRRISFLFLSLFCAAAQKSDTKKKVGCPPQA